MKFNSSLLKKFAAYDLADILDNLDNKAFMSWMRENVGSWRDR